MKSLLIALGIAVAIWLVLIAVLAISGRRVAARELAALIPNLLALFRSLMRDERVPRSSKALVLVGALWMASPIDLIPEFIPVVGPVDDAVVAALVLRHVIRRAGKEVVSSHWRGEPTTLDKILRVSGAA